MFLKRHSHFYFLLMLLVSLKVHSASSADGIWEYLGSQEAHQPAGFGAEERLPITPSLTARVMVKAEGNVYFDVSNAPFTITP